jgi:hypothetical protein
MTGDMNNRDWAIGCHRIEIISIGVPPFSQQGIVITVPYDPAISAGLCETG